jgi:DNA-binding protein H-NS
MSMEFKMAHIHRRWTTQEISRLRALAGRLPPEEIAKEICRTKVATTIKAHELHISLRYIDPNGSERNWQGRGSKGQRA